MADVPGSTGLCQSSLPLQSPGHRPPREEQLRRRCAHVPGCQGKTQPCRTEHLQRADDSGIQRLTDTPPGISEQNHDMGNTWVRSTARSTVGDEGVIITTKVTQGRAWEERGVAAEERTLIPASLKCVPSYTRTLGHPHCQPSRMDYSNA